MKHFLTIKQLSKLDAEHLISRALSFKHAKDHPHFPEYTVANLFYETSTRTRVSFLLAANQLQMPVINLDLHSSSEAKGEVIDDTVKTLSAMGIRLFVIRHKTDGLQDALAKNSKDSIHIINAGDGQHEHPSQAMLDMLTIIENKPHLDKLKIAIVGDIRHSRVANSFHLLASLMGVGELIFVAPNIWQPEKPHFGHVTTSLHEGLAGADVVMCLRVQRERIKAGEDLDFATYRNDYAITQQSLALAKKDAMIMHPGPINRGVELDSDVADGKQSVILQQVQNGVFMRMAIFESLVGEL